MNRPPTRLTLLPSLPPTLAGREGRVIDQAMPLPVRLPTPKTLHHPLSLLLAIAIPATGCFNPLVDLESDDSSGGDTTDAMTTASGSTEATTSEPDGSSGDPLPVCGDAVVEGDEVCDDGVNDGSYGGCNVDCSAAGPFCGDGAVNGEEPCDDGDDVDGNGCNVDCVVSGSVLWTVTYDGPDHGVDSAADVSTDSAGNVLVSGNQSSSGENAGWLRKYTPQGGTVWTVDITAPGGSAANGPIVSLLDDDVVFGGNYDPGDAPRDAWLWRFSAVGESAWTVTHSSAQGGWDSVVDIDIDANGYLYVLYEEGDAPTESTYRTFIRKHSPDGAELWSQFQDPDVRAMLLATDGQGHLIVAGTQTNAGASTVWMQQMNSDGGDIWTQSLDANGATTPTALSANSEGAIAILVSPPAAAPQAILLASDASETGTLLPHLDAPFVVLSSVHLEDDDDLIIAGSTLVDNDDVYGWVSKYDSEGNELWTNTHDGTFDNALSFDTVAAVTTDAFGNVIAAGRIHDSANTLGNIWVTKYAP